MARKRRTGFTSQAGDRNAVRKRPVGAGQNRSSGASGTIRRTSGASKIPVGKIVVCVGGLILAGIGYNIYSVKEKEKADALLREVALEKKAEQDRKLAEEKVKLAKRKAEQDKLAAQQAELEEKQRIEAAKLAAEQERLREIEAAKEAAKKNAIKEAEEKRIRNTATSEYTKLVKDAQKQYSKGEFLQAAESLLGALEENGPEEEKKKLRKVAANAKFFAKMIKEEKPGSEANAESMYWVYFKDGRKLRAKVVRDGANELTIIRDGGVKMTISVKEISRKKMITQKELDRYMVAELNKDKKKCEDAFSWYFTGIKALRYNQLSTAIKCFLKAGKKDPDLSVNVVEYQASKLLSSAALDKSLGYTSAAKKKFEELQMQYPESKAAKLALKAQEEEALIVAQMLKAKEAKRMSQEEIPVLAEKSAPEAVEGEKSEIQQELEEAAEEIEEAGSKELREADALYAAAGKLQRKVEKTDNKTLKNEYYKEALVKLKRAVSIYQAYLDENDDQEIEEKMTLAFRQYYWCKKLQSVE